MIDIRQPVDPSRRGDELHQRVPLGDRKYAPLDHVPVSERLANVGRRGRELCTIEGTYAAKGPLVAATEGDTLVVVGGDGRTLERLTHVGDLRFRRDDRPDVLQWFLPDGDRAGWWIYDLRGNYLEVLRRVAE